MTTSTRRTEPRSRRARGFTLTEVMISAGLSGFILAGVLAAFLMIGRTGYLASTYSEQQDQTRRALDVLGEDTRRAADIRWHSAQSVTLTVPGAGGAATVVTYAYDADPASATFRTFYRVPGDAASTEPRRVLVRDVAPDFAFQRFKLESPSGGENIAATDLETKQIEVSFRTARRGATTATASQAAVSARYILRNKRVSN